MKILWLTWKDLRNPFAGGAELINEEIAKRLVNHGHEVVFLVSGFHGCVEKELRHGYNIIRIGNRYTVYWHAYRYYKTRLKGWPDLVIDEMNTIPFFCKYYVQEKNILFTYQLCREIWFYQMRLPLNFIGYILEPIYLWLLRDRTVITESESTKRDLGRYGFSAARIMTIPVGINVQPVNSIHDVDKYPQPTLLSLGAIRAMKRTLDQIRAFEIAKERIPELRLMVAGTAMGSYGKKVLRRIAASVYAKDIECLGSVDNATKAELMRKSHLILVTSVKEGWGLTVTEANSQGTPAAVYNVDGLRDSVKDEETGLISKENTPQGLADVIVAALRNSSDYARLRKNAWLWSQDFTFDKCFSEFAQRIRLS
jgi:glycosyltransferase involved in cell wall biosynthesis